VVAIHRHRAQPGTPLAGPATAPATPGTAAPALVEWPNGSYAIATTGSRVTVVVREDDPADAANPHRWRNVDGGRWLTWAELTATARLQRLYTTAQLAAHAGGPGGGQALRQPPPAPPASPAARPPALGRPGPPAAAHPRRGGAGR
jgi:hypothetical protein